MNDKIGGSVIELRGLNVRKYNIIEEKMCQNDCIICNDLSFLEEEIDEYNENSSKSPSFVYKSLLKATDDIEQLYAKLKAYCKKENIPDTWISTHLMNDSSCSEKFRNSIDHFKLIREYGESIEG